MNLAELLARQAEARPDAPFVVHESGEISFREMADMASGMAAALRMRGIEAGDHVALLCPNRPMFLAAWLGCAMAGTVCVPLGDYLVGEGLAYVLRQSDAKLLVADADLLREKRERSPEALGDLATLALPAEGEAHGPAGETEAPVPLPDGAPASILYTSGTTGQPKGAVIPHGSYLAASERMARALRVTADDRIMIVLPLFHANPQMYGVMTALQQGCALILRPKFSATAFFDDARRFGATAFTYVGTVLSILAKRVPGEERDHGIRWCTGGGAPAEVWREVETRFGFAVRELYGMTETGGWTTLNTPGASRHGSVGQARDDIEVAILDEEDRALPSGTVGEIAVRPRAPFAFFNGYYRREDLSWAASGNWWFHTGDRGRLDADGFLYFEGRLKELIRKAGEMIAPQEIELALLEHPAVRDCAVVAVPDDVMGDEIKAVVVPAGEADAAALHRHLDGRIPAHMLPRYVEFVEAIPKTATEKIERHKMTGLGAGVIDLAARPATAAAPAS